MTHQMFVDIVICIVLTVIGWFIILWCIGLLIDAIARLLQKIATSVGTLHHHGRVGAWLAFRAGRYHVFVYPLWWVRDKHRIIVIERKWR